MPERINIATIFRKDLFWDVRMEELDLEYDKDLIIPRALFATGAETFEADIEKLENLYPRAVILKELQETEERISNEVCELVARRYEVAPFYRWKIK
jgi:hypothetical protein